MVNKAADAAKYLKEQAKKKHESEEGSDYYDEEDEGEQEVEIQTKKPGVSKVVVEMRLIMKQARVAVSSENQRVRIELSRNGKALQTDWKPVEEETGIANIK